MITKGVKVIVLRRRRTPRPSSPRVKTAVDKGIKVVAYDRLAEGPISAYVSFDNDKVGQLQGEALLDALGAKANADGQGRHDQR